MGEGEGEGGRKERDRGRKGGERGGEEGRRGGGVGRRRGERRPVGVGTYHCQFVMLGSDQSSVPSLVPVSSGLCRAQRSCPEIFNSMYTGLNTKPFQMLTCQTLIPSIFCGSMGFSAVAASGPVMEAPRT